MHFHSLNFFRSRNFIEVKNEPVGTSVIKFGGPSKSEIPLGKWRSPHFSTEWYSRECSIPKSCPTYIKPVLQKWEEASSYVFHLKKSRPDNNALEQGQLKSSKDNESYNPVPKFICSEISANSLDNNLVPSPNVIYHLFVQCKKLCE